MDEGAHVTGADARVNSGVMIQVDELRGTRDAGKGGLLERVGLTHQRRDRTVVIGIRVPVEQPRAGRRLERGPNRPPHGRIETRAEVRDALDPGHDTFSRTRSRENSRRPPTRTPRTGLRPSS